MIEACVSAYAQTIAMCPGDHWRRRADGGRERVPAASSALARVIRRPNAYSTISDFLLNLTRDLYKEGNAFALALRNDRFEVSELHLMRARECSARLAVDGTIFYTLGGNELVERRFGGSPIVPARDVLHVRLHTPDHPLVGESPLRAAAMDAATGDAMARQQLAFYLNQARPSFVLSTDQIYTAEQVRELRARWNEQAQGMNAGGTPILTHGIKPVSLGGSAERDQLVEMMRLTDQHISLVFKVPLQILGIGAAPAVSTEALMQSWISQGLGFALNHIEEAFGLLFGLRGQPDEYLEFDTAALLRSSLKERLEGLAKGVLGGVYSPNEARAIEGLPSVPHGDEPRVQQQVVPLSAAAAIPAAPPAPPVPGPLIPTIEPSPAPASVPVKDAPYGDGFHRYPSDDELRGADAGFDWTERDLLAAADEAERRAA